MLKAQTDPPSSDSHLIITVIDFLYFYEPAETFMLSMRLVPRLF